MTERFFIQLSFKGTRYHGWQIQPNAITVQEELNNALSRILKENVETIGAGRTDTGVHAEFFVAHFDSQNLTKEIEKFVPKYNLSSNFPVYQLNCILPPDISVQSVFKVEPNVHARFDAISRTYEYRISLAKNPFGTDFTWFLKQKPDIEMMNKACKELFNHNDFTSFSKLHSDVKTNFCSILEAEWYIIDKELIFRISANRFLRNMVRSIVGTMLEVGYHKMDIIGFRNVILSRNRAVSGPSVPAHGLYLTDIKYDGISFPDKFYRHQ